MIAHRPRALRSTASHARAAAHLVELRAALAELAAVVSDGGPLWRSGYRSAWSTALLRLRQLEDRLAADLEDRQP